MGKGAHICYFYNEPTNHWILQEQFTYVSLSLMMVSHILTGTPGSNNEFSCWRPLRRGIVLTLRKGFTNTSERVLEETRLLAHLNVQFYSVFCMYSNTYSYFLIFLWSISNKHYCCETKIQYSILPIITSRFYEVVFFSFLNVWQNITSCRALTSRLLLCLNNDQTLYFGGCEGKKQLNTVLREIKEGRRELDLLSEGNVVSLLTSESFTYLNFMDEFPLPFRWV